MFKSLFGLERGLGFMGLDSRIWGCVFMGGMCVFITAVPITKLFARGGGEWGGFVQHNVFFAQLVVVRIAD